MGAEGGAATRSRIAQHLTEFMASLPADADLAAVTMKQVKQALAERLGEDEWACVLRDHKDYLKEQALERLEAASKQRRAAKPAKKKRRVGGEGRGGAARADDKPAGAPSCQHGAGGGSRAEAMDVCQICFRQENDHQTLLCDGCDLAFHTYCLQPALDKIPEGIGLIGDSQKKETSDRKKTYEGKKERPMISAFAQGEWHCSNCVPPIPKDLEAVPIKELKKILISRNVDVTDCVEKKDLVDKIKRIFLL